MREVASVSLDTTSCALEKGKKWSFLEEGYVERFYISSLLVSIWVGRFYPPNYLHLSSSCWVNAPSAVVLMVVLGATR